MGYGLARSVLFFGVGVYFLVVGGAFGGLSGAVSTCSGMVVSLPEEARQQRRYEVRQELKTLLVVVGAIVGVFGSFFTLYVLGAYVVAPVLRYFL